MSDVSKAELDKLNEERYGIPFPVDNFYMPLAMKARLVEFDIDRRTCVPVSDIVDEDRIWSFLSKIRLTDVERLDVPHWKDGLDLHLGAGYAGIDPYLYYSAILKLHPPTVV